jgi:hypothetical protein
VASFVEKNINESSHPPSLEPTRLPTPYHPVPGPRDPI